MRVRTKDRGRPNDPRAPWNEIVPGLWMGGHEYRAADGDLAPAVVDREFDVVYSLHRREGCGPTPPILDHFLDIPDASLTADQIRAVADLATSVTRDWQAGNKVLVRCKSGFNRSGLVIAQVLISAGHSPPEAVTLIRTRRSQAALHNELFVDYLTTGLDLSAQLAGLGTDS